MNIRCVFEQFKSMRYLFYFSYKFSLSFPFRIISNVIEIETRAFRVSAFYICIHVCARFPSIFMRSSNSDKNFNQFHQTQTHFMMIHSRYRGYACSNSRKTATERTNKKKNQHQLITQRAESVERIHRDAIHS